MIGSSFSKMLFRVSLHYVYLVEFQWLELEEGARSHWVI